MFKKNSFHLVFLVFTSSCLANSKNDFIVKIKTPEQINEINLVLTKRLNEVYGGFFSKVKSKINSDNTITFSINRGTDEIDERLRYFIETQGQLRAYIDKHELWFTSKDIIDAKASFDENDNPALMFTLSEAAASQLKIKTNSNIGKILVLELDGNILTEAKIMEPLSKYISIAFTESKQLTARTAMLLKTGELPEPVKIVTE